VVKPLGRTRRRSEDNIKMRLIEMGIMKQTVDQAEDCIQWKALVLVCSAESSSSVSIVS
jgi:hypothetical protein